jgi:hypothetical protein
VTLAPGKKIDAYARRLQARAATHIVMALAASVMLWLQVEHGSRFSPNAGPNYQTRGPGLFAFVSTAPAWLPFLVSWFTSRRVPRSAGVFWQWLIGAVITTVPAVAYWGGAFGSHGPAYSLAVSFAHATALGWLGAWLSSSAAVQ